MIVPQVMEVEASTRSSHAASRREQRHFGKSQDIISQGTQPYYQLRDQSIVT